MAESRSFALHIATSTRLSRAASARASAPLTVVRPTPPLPVMNRNRRVPSTSATLRPWLRPDLGLASPDRDLGPLTDASWAERPGSLGDPAWMRPGESVDI